ncbi:MAG TPA: methyltransferase domain-containing protein [Verrucomicrobiae bacterium]|nr:methyltransferase domain-containing protein [Verrucomicrobiae bacterium]
MATQPHSADQFGAQRDFWWHRDFLDLMATRWRLGEASSLADIGCGLCHWSRLLYPYLRAPARFVGVDREPRWVAEAPEQFRSAFPRVSPDLLAFAQGDATAIPLPDNSFDAVTCQTVLMHLARPLDALREMLRILRPGGLLVCVEPNNLWNHLAFNSLTADERVETIVRRFEFWLRYHRGKIASGEGDHSIGDLLPGYFVAAGLTDIAVHQSDRAAPLFPPYGTPAQRALIQQEQQWRDSATGPWDREELRRRVLGGGGTEAFFETVLAELLEKYQREQQAIAAGTFSTAGGTINYLVSGRKPLPVADHA